MNSRFKSFRPILSSSSLNWVNISRSSLVAPLGKTGAAVTGGAVTCGTVGGAVTAWVTGGTVTGGTVVCGVVAGCAKRSGGSLPMVLTILIAGSLVVSPNISSEGLSASSFNSFPTRLSSSAMYLTFLTLSAKKSSITCCIGVLVKSPKEACLAIVIPARLALIASFAALATSWRMSYSPLPFKIINEGAARTIALTIFNCSSASANAMRSIKSSSSYVAANTALRNLFLALAVG